MLRARFFLSGSQSVTHRTDELTTDGDRIGHITARGKSLASGCAEIRVFASGTGGGPPGLRQRLAEFASRVKHADLLLPQVEVLLEVGRSDLLHGRRRTVSMLVDAPSRQATLVADSFTDFVGRNGIPVDPGVTARLPSAWEAAMRELESVRRGLQRLVALLVCGVAIGLSLLARCAVA